MAVGDIISATRYNQLQGKIAALLGIGSGDKGYNQTVSSNPVAVTDTVTVTDMNTLHTDFNKVYVHINNTDAPTISRVTTDDEITDALHEAYEILIIELEDDRFLLSSAQADIESGGVNSIRNGAAQPWGGTSLPQSINHTVRLTFDSPNARRCFFNAGGQIRFDAILDISAVPADTNLAKNQDWEQMLSNAGQIQFGRATTTNTNPSGTAYAIGNEDLTTSYQTIYLKTGDPAGSYSENEFYIQAKEVNNSTIDFNIVFDDQDVGDGGADEYVAGVLTSSVSHIRASGSYVDNPAPAYQKTSDLT
jgi:hypothetical protein